MTAPSESEILEILRRALVVDREVDDGARTSQELAEQLGIGYQAMMRSLRPLVRSGRVKAVRARRVDIAGRTVPLPAYRFSDDAP